ncbi:MAG: hypothetical protein Q9163_003897 [Psora crenata]
MDQNTELQCGCIIPDELAPAIEFSDILPEGFVGAPAPSAAPVIPKSADNLKPFPSWNPLGNKSYQNCNAVVWANTRRLVTSKLSEQEVYPPLDQVLTFYKTQNPEFDPKNWKKDKDKGMYIQKSLDHLVQFGGPDGQRALAFARVNPEKVEDVQMALATFGSLWLGIRVYDINRAQFNNGEQWTYQPTGEKPLGHAVMAGAYDPNIKIVTWGKVVSLTEGYWKKENVFDAFVVIWPEHIGTRRFMTGVSLQQLADQYRKMIGKDMEIPTAKFNSLFRCQITGGDGVLVTLQKIDAQTSYSSVAVNVVIDIKQAEASNGAFAVESNDLYFIKTKNTASKMVEVQRIQDPAYNKVESWVSGFGTAEAANGLWTIDNGDLYFIKIANTASDLVEVWSASHEGNFQKATYYTSGLKIRDIGFGTYAMGGGNLYMILDANNASGLVEITCVKSDMQYSARSLTHQVTGFKINDVKGKGTWIMGTDGDLFLIKTLGTASGQVELHIATAVSNYQDLSHYSIPFPADQSGVWMIY